MQNKILNKYQKVLRSKQTDAENTLWYHLKNRRLHGFKFRRQHILKGYIVDFICLERNLVIELDGGQHTVQVAYDNTRDAALVADGFKVLRFRYHEVLLETDIVLNVISEALLSDMH